MSHLAFWWLNLASACSLRGIRFPLWPRLGLQLLRKPHARGTAACRALSTPSPHSALPTLQQQPSHMSYRLPQPGTAKGPFSGIQLATPIEIWVQEQKQAPAHTKSILYRSEPVPVPGVTVQLQCQNFIPFRITLNSTACHPSSPWAGVALLGHGMAGRALISQAESSRAGHQHL